MELIQKCNANTYSIHPTRTGTHSHALWHNNNNRPSPTTLATITMSKTSNFQQIIEGMRPCKTRMKWKYQLPVVLFLLYLLNGSTALLLDSCWIFLVESVEYFGCL